MDLIIKNLSNEFNKFITADNENGSSISRKTITIITKKLKKLATAGTFQGKDKKALLALFSLYFQALAEYSSNNGITANQDRIIVEIRNSLKTFLAVVEELRIEVLLVKTIIKFLKNVASKSSFLKALLRMYAVLLRSVQADKIEKISLKRRRFIFLFGILNDNKGDVELQAAIIEVLNIFFRGPNNMDFIGNVCPFAVAISSQQNDIYNIIRSVVVARNQIDEKTFSIYCKSIKWGADMVVEYTGTETSAIWLDLDTFYAKMSFFCCKEFLETCKGISFKTSTTWELVSFHVKDVIDAAFSYEPCTGFQMTLKLKTSSFNVLSKHDPKFEKIEHLVITVSTEVEGFRRMFEDILPGFFKENRNLQDIAVEFTEKDSRATPTSSALLSSSRPASRGISSSSENLSIFRDACGEVVISPNDNQNDLDTKGRNYTMASAATSVCFSGSVVPKSPGRPDMLHELAMAEAQTELQQLTQSSCVESSVEIEPFSSEDKVVAWLRDSTELDVENKSVSMVNHTEVALSRNIPLDEDLEHEDPSAINPVEEKTARGMSETSKLSKDKEPKLKEIDTSEEDETCDIDLNLLETSTENWSKISSMNGEISLMKRPILLAPVEEKITAPGEVLKDKTSNNLHGTLFNEDAAETSLKDVNILSKSREVQQTTETRQEEILNASNGETSEDEVMLSKRINRLEADASEKPEEIFKAPEGETSEDEVMLSKRINKRKVLQHDTGDQNIEDGKLSKKMKQRRASRKSKKPSKHQRERLNDEGHSVNGDLVKTKNKHLKHRETGKPSKDLGKDKTPRLESKLRKSGKKEKKREVNVSIEEEEPKNGIILAPRVNLPDERSHDLKEQKKVDVNLSDEVNEMPGPSYKGDIGEQYSMDEMKNSLLPTSSKQEPLKASDKNKDSHITDPTDVPDLHVSASQISEKGSPIHFLFNQVDDTFQLDQSHDDIEGKKPNDISDDVGNECEQQNADTNMPELNCAKSSEKTLDKIDLNGQLTTVNVQIRSPVDSMSSDSSRSNIRDRSNQNDEARSSAANSNKILIISDILVSSKNSVEELKDEHAPISPKEDAFQVEEIENVQPKEDRAKNSNHFKNRTKNHRKNDSELFDAMQKSMDEIVNIGPEDRFQEAADNKKTIKQERFEAVRKSLQEIHEISDDSDDPRQDKSQFCSQEIRNILESQTQNKTQVNAAGAKGKRKLYNPNDLSYLKELTEKQQNNKVPKKNETKIEQARRPRQSKVKNSRSAKNESLYDKIVRMTLCKSRESRKDYSGRKHSTKRNRNDFDADFTPEASPCKKFKANGLNDTTNSCGQFCSKLMALIGSHVRQHHPEVNKQRY